MHELQSHQDKIMRHNVLVAVFFIHIKFHV